MSWNATVHVAWKGLCVLRELRTSVDGIWAAGDVCSVRAGAQGPHWFQMRLWTQVLALCTILACPLTAAAVCVGHQHSRFSVAAPPQPASAKGRRCAMSSTCVQARQMGIHAAHSMAGVLDQTGSGFFLELFAHSTRFAGKRVRGSCYMHARSCCGSGRPQVRLLPCHKVHTETPHFCPAQVTLLGLYNGQKLEHEPTEDMVTYSRALKVLLNSCQHCSAHMCYTLMSLQTRICACIADVRFHATPSHVSG